MRWLPWVKFFLVLGIQLILLRYNSYNHYHLSPNGIPSGNQRWYGLVYLVYK